MLHLDLPEHRSSYFMMESPEGNLGDVVAGGSPAWAVPWLRYGREAKETEKTHPAHPKENVVNGPGAPAWLTKSSLTVFNMFLLVLRAVINATMYVKP